MDARHFGRRQAASLDQFGIPGRNLLATLLDLVLNSLIRRSDVDFFLCVFLNARLVEVCQREFVGLHQDRHSLVVLVGF